MGVVANGISNEEGGYGYGFGHGYGYGYGYSDGYGHEDAAGDPLESDSTQVMPATQSAVPNEPEHEAGNKPERVQAPFEGIRPRRAA